MSKEPVPLKGQMTVVFVDSHNFKTRKKGYLANGGNAHSNKVEMIFFAIMALFCGIIVGALAYGIATG